MLVLSSVLGWKTYADQITAVALAESKYDIHIHRFEPSLFERLLVKRHNRTSWSTYHRFFDPVNAFKGVAGRSIRAEIDRIQPDIIHFGAHPAAAAHAFRESPIPFTVTLDCTQLNMERLKETRLWTESEKKREGALFQRAARIYPWSDWAAKSLITDYGIPAEKIEIILPSVEMVNASPPIRNPSDGHLPKIVFVGNDFLRKGGDMLHRWVTGPLKGTCELHIISNDLRSEVGGDNVFVHGGMRHSELINEFMPSMDLICHPTQSDMSAFVLIEAARAGLPCVASAVGGIPSLVDEGTTGFLVDRRDENGFLDRLRTLIGDRDLRERMGAAAYEHALARFDSKTNYKNLFDEISGLAMAEAAPTREPTL